MLHHRLTAVVAALALGVGLAPAALQAAPTAATPAAVAADRPQATALRVATFNVRTARATSDQRTWLRRAPDVAGEILARNPGVVLLQELGPGRADGKKAKLNGSLRQTTSLTDTLGRMGGGRYKLVRSTAYVAPGSAHGTQGARILYDSSRYALETDCPEMTGKRAFNPSCAFDLPVAAGDSERLRRSAAYAEFRDRRTGQRFLVVSAHLDSLHSKSNRVEAKYNGLRASQARAIAHRMAAINTSGLPVVFGGDINSWQTDRSRHAPYRVLVAKGYRDTASASKRINLAYPTVNHWRTKLKKSKRGSGPRLDVVLVKGAKKAKRYENKMARIDSARASDHNMVVTDVLI